MAEGKLMSYGLIPRPKKSVWLKESLVDVRLYCNFVITCALA